VFDSGCFVSCVLKMRSGCLESEVYSKAIVWYINGVKIYKDSGL
jgi:hypothetical protein